MEFTELMKYRYLVRELRGKCGKIENDYLT